jgi:hypothetical protein
MRYQWIAVYKDGSELRQFNADGTENRYGDIKRNELEGFMLLTIGNHPKDYPILCVHIDEGCRLIYRRRIEQWGNEENQKHVVWIVGMQRRTSRGVVSECISAVFEDGHIEQRSTWTENTHWFYAPKIHPHEGEIWDSDSSE